MLLISVAFAAMLITGDIFNGCQSFHVFIPRFLDIFCFQAVMVVLMFYERHYLFYKVFSWILSLGKITPKLCPFFIWLDKSFYFFKNSILRQNLPKNDQKSLFSKFFKINLQYFLWRCH